MSMTEPKENSIKTERFESSKEEETERIETLDNVTVKIEPLLENVLYDSIKTEKNGKPIFTCNQCTHSFEHIELYELHISIHNQTASTQSKHCPCCKRQYKQIDKYTTHIQKHLEKYYHCPYCSQVFFNHNIFSQHVLEHKRNGALCCPYCGKTFTIQKSLTMHIRVHTNERPYECDKCLKRFKQISSLRTHKQLIHSEGNPHECEVCHGMFCTKSSLRRHMKRLHHTGRTISCKPCGLTFLNKDLFNKHRMEDHKKLSGFFEICPDCNEEFFTYREYYHHKKIHISNKTAKEKEKKGTPELQNDLNTGKEEETLLPLNEKTEICWLCGENVISKLFLEHKNEHLLMTSEEMAECMETKKFPCKTCNKIYYSKKSLLSHMDSHMEKVYQCSKECSTQHLFSYNGLKRHERKFHGAARAPRKMTKCFLCGIDIIHINYSQHLNQHLQTTTAELSKFKMRKKYPCKQCTMVLPSKGFLIRHAASHMPKQYMCEKNSGCNRVLFSYMGLRAHYRTFHDEFACKVCKKTFTGLPKFKAHHHKSDYASSKFGKKIFKCSWCSAKFSNPMAITQHYRTHKISDFSCRICDKRYPIATDIKKHMNKIHKQKFTTEDCYRYLVNKVDTSDSHIEEAFVCDWCKVGFSTEEALTKHAEIHSDNRYQCKKCKTCFTDFAKYARHLKNNVCVRWVVEALMPEIKELKCIYCHETFDTYFDTSKHITKTHLKEAYSCRFCDSSHAVESLRSHLVKRHSRRKKYLCAGCNISFVTLSKYLHHRRWCVECPLIQCERPKRQELISQNNISIGDDIQEDIVDVPETVLVNEFGDIIVPEHSTSSVLDVSVMDVDCLENIE